MCISSQNAVFKSSMLNSPQLTVIKIFTYFFIIIFQFAQFALLTQVITAALYNIYTVMLKVLILNWWKK